MNKQEIIEAYARHVEKAGVAFAKEVTPEKVLGGKFVRADISVFDDDFCYVSYLSVDKSSPIEITLSIPLHSFYNFTCEITDGEDAAMGYTMECTDFTKKNVRSEIKKAYDDFVRSLA